MQMVAKTLSLLSLFATRGALDFTIRQLLYHKLQFTKELHPCFVSTRRRKRIWVSFEHMPYFILHKQQTVSDLIRLVFVSSSWNITFDPGMQIERQCYAQRVGLSVQSWKRGGKKNMEMHPTCSRSRHLLCC